MLIAPTVINKGTVAAPDGQVIAAAGTRVFCVGFAEPKTSMRGLLVEVDSPAGLAASRPPTPASGRQAGWQDRGAERSSDKLGHVTNLGELSTARQCHHGGVCGQPAGHRAGDSPVIANVTGIPAGAGCGDGPGTFHAWRPRGTRAPAA
jgi:hypothetical protein